MLDRVDRATVSRQSIGIQRPDNTEPAPVSTPHDAVGLDAVVRDLVAGQAPRLFAVVQVADRPGVDARVAAWGMAFDDRGEVVGVDGRLHLRLCDVERAATVFSHEPHVAAHLVWLPAARPVDVEPA